jgi:deoxyribodipyrimidine photolyase
MADATHEPCRRWPASLGVQAVYASHDDEPDALARDARVRGALADAGIALHTGKDHVVFERSEVMTADRQPVLSVFTPYKNAWLKKLDAAFLAPYPWRAMPARWRRCRRACHRRARRWPRSASSPPTCTR